MVDVAEFLKEAGRWLTPQYVPITKGETIEITGEGEIDSTTFESPYLILPVKYKGEDWMLRLGKRAVARLVEDFGTSDTKQWVGKYLEVERIESYKGLGTKGIIWRGVGEQWITCKCGARFSLKALEKLNNVCPVCNTKLK